MKDIKEGYIFNNYKDNIRNICLEKYSPYMQ